MANNKTANMFTYNVNFEPQLKHNFRLYVDGLPEILSLALVSFPLPGYTLSEEQLQFGNQEIYTAGRLTIEGGDVVFNDYVTADTEKLLFDWFCQVYNPVTGVRQRASVYKKNGTLVQLEGDMESSSRPYYVEGMYPTSFRAGEVSYADPTKKQITITLKFDNSYRI